jgi:hypothetical protein
MTSTTYTEDPTRRIIRNIGSEHEYWWNLSNNTTNAYTGYRPVLLIEKLNFLTYLIEDQGKVKYFDNELKTIDTAPATEEMFDSYGMYNLSLILKNMDDLSDNPKILVWSPEKLKSPKLKFKAIPKPQLVLPAGDIPLNNIRNIDYFKIYANTFAHGVIKIIASTDGGQTWVTWDKSRFKTIDSNDLNEVKSEGMDINTFNALTTEWNQIVTNKIRFAYYLEINAITDVAQVDKLEIQFDILGKWKKAVHGTEYDYEYSNDNLKVSLLSDGSYKINYQD